VLEAEARRLNEGFISRLERGRPFVLVKLATTVDGRVSRRADVDHHDAARTQQRAFGRERLEIHPHIGFFWTQNRNRRTTRNHSLKLVAGSNTAADIIDQLRKRNAKFTFDDCGFVYMAAYTVKLGAGVLFIGPEALEPVNATITMAG
jgi:hypothetical protein